MIPLEIPNEIYSQIICKVNNLQTFENLRLTCSGFCSLVHLHFNHIKTIKLDCRQPHSIDCEQIVFKYQPEQLNQPGHPDNQDIENENLYKKARLMNFIELYKNHMKNVKEVQLNANEWDVASLDVIVNTFSPNFTKVHNFGHAAYAGMQHLIDANRAKLKKFYNYMEPIEGQTL